MFYVLILLSFFFYSVFTQNCQPFGVRLSLGEKYSPTSGDVIFRITFNTHHDCPSLAELEGRPLSCKKQQLVVDSRSFSVSYSFSTYVHICDVTSINRYQFSYKIQNQQFRGTIPNPSIQNQNHLIIGDWGIITINTATYDNIFPCIAEALQPDYPIKFATILFMGDMAYDLENDNCQQYVRFLTAIQPFTSKLPFMPTIGNHQDPLRRPISGYLFTRSFIMPNNSQTRNNFYSFTIGRSHFTSFNAYRDNYQLEPLQTSQIISSLRKDYELAKDRTDIDWYFPFSHYPIYCGYTADPNNKNCEENPYRFLAYAQLFHQLKVPIYFSGHIHIYERNYPVRLDNTSITQHSRLLQYDGLNISVFENPGTPIYIVVGDGGSDSYVRTQDYEGNQWTAFKGINTGYGMLHIYNESVIGFTHYKAGRGSQTCYLNDGVFVERRRDMFVYIVIGVVLGVLVIGVVIMIVLCCRKKNNTEQQNEDLKSGRHINSNQQQQVQEA